LSILDNVQTQAMPLKFDYIDLRVPDLKKAEPFCEHYFLL